MNQCVKEKMDYRLLAGAAVKLVIGVVLIGLLLFLPAGTLGYIQGWILIGVLFLPMLAVGIVMAFKSPDLLRKRLNSKEKEGGQKAVVALSGMMFLAAFVLAGLDRRFGWTSVPEWGVWTAVSFFLLSYLMYAEVLRENAYLSRTIEVQEGQKVIDTGLYGVVRHPMYAATVIMFLSMPIILGSLISLAVMSLYIPLIVVRLLGEEKILEASLPGYIEYKSKVRYRIIPYLW